VGRFSEWLRRNSEHYLIGAAEASMAERYLHRQGPVEPGGPGPFIWRRLFVPVYRRVPWKLRRAVILSLPGSHRRSWKGRSAAAGVKGGGAGG
jgi:hypothetical protein